jgi:hypothetical protein
MAGKIWNNLPVQSSKSESDAARVSIGTILDTIGSGALLLANDPTSRNLAVSNRTLYDPHDELPSVAHGLLFAAGLRAGPDLEKLLHRAAATGHTVVMVKAGGEEAIHDAAALADRLGIALVTVGPGITWLQLEHLVATALAGAGTSVTTALSALAVGDLFSLANAIAAATGGATAIEDMDTRVLAYSTVPGQQIDPARQEGILGRLVPDLPDNAWHYRQVYSREGAVHLPATDTDLARLACAVRSGTKIIGSVWVTDSGGLTPGAERLLSGACEVAALHMLRARASEDFARQRRADLVREVLETGDTGAAHQLGLRAERPLWVAAIEPETSAPEPLAPDPNRIVDVLSLELTSRSAQAGCAVIGGRVYALLTWPDGQRPDTLMRHAVRACGAAVRAKLRAGLAGPVHDLVEVVRVRTDADQVVDLISARPDLGPVAVAEDVREALTLRRLGQRLRMSELSPLADHILRDDAERGTDTARLLLTWLASLGDVRRTASEMLVHPNTVRYRLSRLRSVNGFEPDRPDQLLLLWLALRLAEDDRDAAR